MGNNSYTDRKAISISKERAKKRGAAGKRLMSSERITELVDEEEKNSDVGDEMIDDEETKEIMQTIRTNQKRNLLCKNLLDQTKELCYSHSPVYKDFDAMF